MKNILFIIILCIPITVFAQNKSSNYTSSYMYESFEKPAFPPRGWVKVLPLGGTGWSRLTINCPFPGWLYFALPAPQWGGKSYAVADFVSGNSSWAIPGFPSDQWLITPPVTISNGDSLKFKFLPCAVSSQDIDSLDVLVSVTNNSITSFTTTLMSILTSNFSTNTVWASFSADLSSFSGQTIYVAFREHISNNNNNGVGFALDMVSVGHPPLNDVGVETTDISPIIAPGYIVPKATVSNYGTAAQTFSVTMTVNPGNYSSTKTITSLPAGQTFQMSFDSLNAINNTFYQVITRTTLTGDADSTNNADTIHATCYLPDPIIYDNRSYFPSLIFNIPSTEYGGLPSGQNIINVADDFTVPSNSVWTITSINTEGYSIYTSANIDRFGIKIYDDKNYKPLSVVASDTVSLKNENNTFDTAQVLILNNSITLTPGKYWLSVYAIYDTVSLQANGAWDWFLGSNQKGDSCQIENYSQLFGGSFTWVSYAVYSSHIIFPAPAVYGKAAFFALHGTTVTGVKGNKLNNIIIFPDPANDFLNITNAENSIAYVYNSLGRVVLTKKCDSAFTTLSLSELSTGSYIIKIVSDQVITKKFEIIR